MSTRRTKPGVKRAPAQRRSSPSRVPAVPAYDPKVNLWTVSDRLQRAKQCLLELIDRAYRSKNLYIPRFEVMTQRIATLVEEAKNAAPDAMKEQFDDFLLNWSMLPRVTNGNYIIVILEHKKPLLNNLIDL